LEKQKDVAIKENLFSLIFFRHRPSGAFPFPINWPKRKTFIKAGTFRLSAGHNLFFLGVRDA
jgi:hypothetical protein